VRGRRHRLAIRRLRSFGFWSCDLRDVFRCSGVRQDVPLHVSLHVGLRLLRAAGVFRRPMRPRFASGRRACTAPETMIRKKGTKTGVRVRSEKGDGVIVRLNPRKNGVRDNFGHKEGTGWLRVAPSPAMDVANLERPAFPLRGSSGRASCPCDSLIAIQEVPACHSPSPEGRCSCGPQRSRC